MRELCAHFAVGELSARSAQRAGGRFENRRKTTATGGILEVLASNPLSHATTEGLDDFQLAVGLLAYQLACAGPAEAGPGPPSANAAPLSAGSTSSSSSASSSSSSSASSMADVTVRPAQPPAQQPQQPAQQPQPSTTPTSQPNSAVKVNNLSGLMAGLGGINGTGDLLDAWPSAPGANQPAQQSRTAPDPSMMEKLVQDLQVRRVGSFS